MLDSKRLGNQRVEARMILRWLRNPEDYPRQQNAGYTIMWKGYEEALCMYYNACCEEWARRGGQNIVCQPEAVVASRVKLPPWLGDDELHVTHRSALLHKLPEHYAEHGWDDEISDPKVEYLWPRPVEGKEDEYELCPAFWKKKKKKSASTDTNTPKPNTQSTKQRPKRGTNKQKREKSGAIETTKQRPKRGSKTVQKSRGSSRLANKRASSTKRIH